MVTAVNKVNTEGRKNKEGIEAIHFVVGYKWLLKLEVSLLRSCPEFIVPISLTLNDTVIFYRNKSIYLLSVSPSSGKTINIPSLFLNYITGRPVSSPDLPV